MKHFVYFLIVLLLAVAACKTAKQTSTGAQEGKYHEDLSAWRPKIEDTVKPETTRVEVKRDPKAYVEPHYAVNNQVDAILDSIDRINHERRFIEGYTIQLFSGLRRDDAMAAKKEMTVYLPDLIADVQYVQPNYRVKTGKYYNRLDAQKDFGAVKRYFPSAIVVPDKIPIN